MDKILNPNEFRRLSEETKKNIRIEEYYLERINEKLKEYGEDPEAIITYPLYIPIDSLGNNEMPIKVYKSIEKKVHASGWDLETFLFINPDETSWYRFALSPRQDPIFREAILPDND